MLEQLFCTRLLYTSSVQRHVDVPVLHKQIKNYLRKMEMKQQREEELEEGLKSYRCEFNLPSLFSCIDLSGGPLQVAICSTDAQTKRLAHSIVLTSRSCNLSLCPPWTKRLCIQHNLFEFYCLSCRFVSRRNHAFLHQKIICEVQVSCLPCVSACMKTELASTRKPLRSLRQF